MRIKHDNMIEICQVAELEEKQIRFLTIDDKMFVADFVSIFSRIA